MIERACSAAISGEDAIGVIDHSLWGAVREAYVWCHARLVQRRARRGEERARCHGHHGAVGQVKTGLDRALSKRRRANDDTAPLSWMADARISDALAELPLISTSKGAPSRMSFGLASTVSLFSMSRPAETRIGPLPTT